MSGGEAFFPFASIPRFLQRRERMFAHFSSTLEVHLFFHRNKLRHLHPPSKLLENRGLQSFNAYSIGIVLLIAVSQGK